MRIERFEEKEKVPAGTAEYAQRPANLTCNLHGLDRCETFMGFRNVSVSLDSSDLSPKGDWTGWHTADPSASVSLSFSGAVAVYMRGSFAVEESVQCAYSITLDDKLATRITPSSSPDDFPTLYSRNISSSGSHTLTLHDISPYCGGFHMGSPILTIDIDEASTHELYRPRDAPGSVSSSLPSTTVPLITTHVLAASATATASISRHHGLSTGAIVGLAVGLPLGFWALHGVRQRVRSAQARSARPSVDPESALPPPPNGDPEPSPGAHVSPPVPPLPAGPGDVPEREEHDMPPPTYERVFPAGGASVGAGVASAPPSSDASPGALDSVADAGSRALSWGNVAAPAKAQPGAYVPQPGLPPHEGNTSNAMPALPSQASSRVLSWGSVVPPPPMPESATRKP